MARIRSASLSQLIQDQEIQSISPVISRALKDTSTARPPAGSGGTGILSGIINILGDPAGTPKAETSLSAEPNPAGGVQAQVDPKAQGPKPTALTTASKRSQRPDKSTSATSAVASGKTQPDSTSPFSAQNLYKRLNIAGFA